MARTTLRRVASVLMAPFCLTQSMTHVLPLVVIRDLLKTQLSKLGWWLYFYITFYQQIYKHLLFKFQIVLGLMENPNMWELWLKHTDIYSSKVLVVCLNCFFFLTSLVTHGQVTATPVCVTRIPWASIVSPFNACQCRAPTAVSPGSSWSTRQMAAAQHSHVVSFSDTELNENLLGLLLFFSSRWWQGRLPLMKINPYPLFSCDCFIL